jgi:dTMP kinase
VPGALIAFEGLDQSGKQTQAEALRDFAISHGRECRLLSFPDYDTAIGREIAKALEREHEYAPDTLQLLYVANRYEKRSTIEALLAAGTVVVCDRYAASSIAYGEAQGLDGSWLAVVQRYLPKADLTIVLDIAPETAARRKTAGRDRYERDLALLARVRESYHSQARQDGWLVLNGERDKGVVTTEVLTAARTLLERP